ncbi:MAG: GGDEF domain-containing protein [Acidimicrobiales bacterium]
MTDDDGSTRAGGEPMVAREATQAGNFKLLARLTLEDPLTGLVNQLLLHDRLAQALTRSVRRGDRVAVFYIDLNYFGDINDQHGFEAGNSVLREVARRLKAIIRSEDTLSRVGGNEFVAVMSIANAEALGPLTKRVQSVFDQPIEIDGTAITTSACFAIVLGEGADSAEDLLAKADQAMYVEKNEKRPPREH